MLINVNDIETNSAKKKTAFDIEDISLMPFKLAYFRVLTMWILCNFQYCNSYYFTKNPSSQIKG
jgi:hypothetical protein